MTTISKENYHMYCEHANEHPNVCPCPEECGCRVWGSCWKTTPQYSFGVMEPLALEKRLERLEAKLDEILRRLT